MKLVLLFGAVSLLGCSGGSTPSGQTGLQGPQGPIGPQGLQGPIGPAGPQGLQGVPGSQGVQGPVGPAGPQGVQGPQGANGLPGLSQVWVDATGTAIVAAAQYGDSTPKAWCCGGGPSYILEINPELPSNQFTVLPTPRLLFLGLNCTGAAFIDAIQPRVVVDLGVVTTNGRVRPDTMASSSIVAQAYMGRDQVCVNVTQNVPAALNVGSLGNVIVPTLSVLPPLHLELRRQ